jgi:hypothetical protein
MARKRKTNRAHPLMIFWSKAEARRFSEDVERFSSMVNDLETILAAEKRKRVVKAPAKNGEAAGEVPA